jgi:hypothetical protein
VTWPFGQGECYHQRMKTWLVAVVLSAAMMPAAGASPVETATLVAGTVVDTMTNRAVVGATVSLVFAPGVPPVQTRTDDKGHFAIETMEAPTYVVVRRAGFDTYTVTVAGVAQSVAAELHIALNPHLILISHHGYFPGPCAAFHPSQLWDSYVLAPRRCGMPAF